MKSVRIFAVTLLVLVGSTAVFAQAPKPKQAAIASAHHLATDAGHEVLALGGNAFDAAIAVSAVLGVVEPYSSGFGGGGFYLLHRANDGMQVMVDGRERAPAAVDAKLFLNEAGELDRDKSVNGALSAGIPGHPAAMVHLAKNYGRLPLSKSLAPAIRIASEGFVVEERFHAMLASRKAVIARFPDSAKVFLPNGELPAIGDVVKQPELAHTISLLAKHGNDGFYRGEVAQKLVAGVKAAGGNWSAQDLADYQIVERKPLQFAYRGHQIITSPPPSSGGVAMATILNVLGGYDLSKVDSATRIHLIVEAMRRAYRDRSFLMGDPDFVQMPISLLTSNDYAAGLRASIRFDKATPSASLPGQEAPLTGSDTSHFSVLDRDGNMVAATQTVNLTFGSGMIAPGTGILLNNEMDDFALKEGVPNAFGLIGSEANAPKAGKRMLSSMTPTFVIGKDRTAIIGTPGGSRIITMVLLGVLEFIDGGDAQAVAALPRFHHQYLPDAISAEPNAIAADDAKKLREMGHTVSDGERTWGNMYTVVWNHKDNSVQGGADPRSNVGKASTK